MPKQFTTKTLKSLLISCILMGQMFAIQIAAAEVNIAVPPINPSEKQLALPNTGNNTDQGQYLTQTFLPNLTKGFISTAGALSFLFVVVSGIQILASFGGEDEIGKAKKTLIWALAGLLISILSYAIVQAIVSISFKT